jgi:N4-gp56 family major capsid protein
MVTNTTSTVLAADLQTYFAKRLLVVAEPVMVFKQFANLEPIPANASKTISFTQYGKLGLVSSALAEGASGAGTVLASTALTASINQYGSYVQITDLAELTVKHPVIQEALYLLGRQAGESIDQLIQNVVLAGTNVQYANAKGARASLAAGDVMTTTEIRKSIKTLRAAAAVPFDSIALGQGSADAMGNGSGTYVLVVDPSVEADITADATFLAASEYSAVTKLFNDEVGRWFGVRVVRSNNMVAITSTTTVHTSLLIAKNAYAVSDLQNLSTYIEGPGSVADPLHQVRTLGWKCSFAVTILNQNFALRVESGSAYN